MDLVSIAKFQILAKCCLLIWYWISIIWSEIIVVVIIDCLDHSNLNSYKNVFFSNNIFLIPIYCELKFFWSLKLCYLPFSATKRMTLSIFSCFYDYLRKPNQLHLKQCYFNPLKDHLLVLFQLGNPLSPTAIQHNKTKAEIFCFYSIFFQVIFKL